MTRTTRLHLTLLALVALVWAARVEAQVFTTTQTAAQYVTAEDGGPQDGVFDSIVGSYAATVNNGWTSLRGAVTFDVSGIPASVSVRSATLSLLVNCWEGTRNFAVHGFGDDGVMQLADFGRDGVIGSVSIGPEFSGYVTFDVTALVTDVVAAGRPFLAVVTREDPPQSGTNYTVIFVDFAMLRIEYVEDLPQTVDIDIKPGAVPNAINRLSRGLTTVGVLSSSQFDVRSLDPSSLTFGRTGDEPSLAFCNPQLEDVNWDGLLDAVCHFRTRDTGFLSPDTQGIVKGRTFDGVNVKGTDSVRIVR